MHRKNYSALVRHQGNSNLFRAIELSILSVLQSVPLHFHVEGLRGTGKTTIIRAARDVLPYIERIKGCMYNCHPARPHCPNHREGQGPWETEWVQIPFVEISHSAKLGTVVGSIDLERLTDREHPEAALRPGTLAQAHRGIVLVDEINRLADTSPELVDVLLDVMGTKPGRLQIEETGLPRVELPVLAVVWAASNPDEEPGPLEDIRRQLSDRFDLLVTMSRPAERTQVRDILRQAGLATRYLPGSALRKDSHIVEGARQEDATRTRLATGGAMVPHPLPEEITRLLADIYVDFGLESLRAVEAWQLVAQLAELLDGTATTAHGLGELAPLVLGHRVDLGTLGDIVRYLRDSERERTLAGSSSAGEDEESGASGPPAAANAGADLERVDEMTRNPEGDGPVEAEHEKSEFAATGGEETLWRKLFESFRNLLSPPVQAGNADSERPGARGADAGQAGGSPANDWWPGLTDIPGHATQRRDVAYRREAHGSPAGAGQHAAGEGLTVVAPPDRARLLHELPLERWVPDAHE